jgi:3-dehydroquinate dehydratase-2
MKIVIINGPNLNLLGKREPSIYGTRSMEQVLVDIQRAHMDVHFHYLQSNHEGDLIDWIQNYGIKAMRREGDEAKGIILNAGGYTHTSVALRDAVACAEIPVVEVHISDIRQREDFRRVSLLTDVCAHSIIGHGTDGYKEAVEWIRERVES